jgi:uncharacterized protein
VINVKKAYIQEIPLLHIVKGDIIDNSLPTIIFIHGFTSAKEHNLHYAYYLAEKGFRVLLPDCLYHGERDEGFSEEKLSPYFWKIVLTTIGELKIIVDEFERKGLIKDNLIGVSGTSMGGIVTLGALTQYPWIHTAVSLMGSPAYVDFAKAQIDYFTSLGYHLPYTEEELESIYSELTKYDLSLHPEKLNERPLMFWHGKKDEMVPFNYAHTFYERNRTAYINNEDKLFFMADERAGHKVSREGVLHLVKWFDKYLN